MGKAPLMRRSFNADVRNPEFRFSGPYERHVSGLKIQADTHHPHIHRLGPPNSVFCTTHRLTACSMHPLKNHQALHNQLIHNAFLTPRILAGVMHKRFRLADTEAKLS